MGQANESMFFPQQQEEASEKNYPHLKSQHGG
jgi:hypothetical protein